MRALLIGAAVLLVGCEGPPEPKATVPPPQFETVAGRQGVGDASLIERGDRLSLVLGCRGCHGSDLTGRPWSEEARFAISYTSNLTRAVPDYSDGQLDRAIRHGVRRDGSAMWDMPSEIFTHLAEADMRSLIAWLRTLQPAGRVPPPMAVGPEGRRDMGSGRWKSAKDLARIRRDSGPPRLDGGHEWARYMTRATCGECHGLDLGGGNPDYPPASPDLIVAGAYTRAQFHHLLRTGEPPGGRRLRLMGDVARGRFAHLTDGEVDAIYNYLAACANRPQ